MKIHHCLNKAIMVGGNGIGNIVEDNEVWMTSLIHEGITEGGKWAGAISAARSPRNTVIRRNTVHETWGLGIQTYEAYDTIIEDNVVWNNQMSHFYVNNAPGTIVRRNLSYNTPASEFVYKGSVGASFAYCDEKSSPQSRDVVFVNNLSLGGSRGFYAFGRPNSMRDFLVAHNTFVNSKTAGIQINAGDHDGSRVYNNIVVQENDAPVAIVPSDPNLDFSHNLWSKTPPTVVSGDGDVISNPLLAKSGSTNPGSLTSEWFKILSTSPARDMAMVISEVVEDFFRHARGSDPDMGAHEFTE